MPTGRTALEQNLRTREKENDLLSWGFKVETIWECDIRRILKGDKVMKEKYEKMKIFGPLVPRDAYCGGRTGPLSLYEKISEEEEGIYDISLTDIRSLYPSCMHSFEYPIGIPEIIEIPPNEQEVNWTRPDQNPYKGLIKAFVVPPKNLSLPVLPVKHNKLLLFSLCHSCTIEYDKKPTRDPNYECLHETDEERGFVITTTSMELNLSLEMQYRVKKVHSVYNFKTFSKDLFQKYVECCLKLKVENDDFPPELTTDEEIDSFIRVYKERFNIVLDKNNIKKNPNLRFVAKICANCLFGRFSLRNNLATTVVTSVGLKAASIIEDETCEVSSIEYLTATEVMIIYTSHKDFIKENPTSNIIISLWTTSAARVVLYRFMLQVEKDKNSKLLYTVG